MNHTHFPTISVRGLEIDTSCADDITLAKELYGISDDEINEALTEARGSSSLQDDYCNVDPIDDDNYYIMQTKHSDDEVLIDEDLDWHDTETGFTSHAEHANKLEEGYAWYEENGQYVKLSETYWREINDDQVYEDSRQLSLFETTSHYGTKTHDTAWRSHGPSYTQYSKKSAYVRPKKTSDSNPLKPAYIKVGEGSLGLFICPGKVGEGISGDHERDLHKDLAVLRDHNMSVLFGLMPGYELTQYKADGLLTECAEYGIDYRHVGWTDRSTPDNDTFERDVKEAASALWNGDVVGVHCRGGLGRTGSFAGCVLAECGFAVDEIMALLKDARGYMCPETNAQKTFVKTWAVQRMIERNDQTKIKDLEAVAIYNALKRALS